MILRTSSSTSISPTLEKLVNLRGGELTNNPRINQKRGNFWIETTEDFCETSKPKKQRIKSFTLDGVNERGAEASLPNVRTNESEDSVRTNELEGDGTRSLLPFDGGFESRSNSMSLCISHLNAAYVANFYFLAVAICHMAVVAHAIMPDHLLSEFKVSAEVWFRCRNCIRCYELVISGAPRAGEVVFSGLLRGSRMRRAVESGKSGCFASQRHLLSWLLQ